MASLAATEAPDELGQLLEFHEQHIEALKSNLKDLLVSNPETESGTKYDDIWILRYVLSNCADPKSDKGLKRAEDSIRKSISWRRKNAATLKDILEGKPVPFDAKFKEFIAVFRLFGDDGGPINIVCLNGSSPGSLMDNASFDQVEEYLLMTKEEDGRLGALDTPNKDDASFDLVANADNTTSFQSLSTGSHKGHFITLSSKLQGGCSK